MGGKPDNFRPLHSDLETEESRASKLNETAQELKNQGSEERKAGKNAEHYQKTKIANRLVDQVQFGKEFAKGIATRWRSAELKGIEAVKELEALKAELTCPLAKDGGAGFT